MMGIIDDFDGYDEMYDNYYNHAEEKKIDGTPKMRRIRPVGEIPAPPIIESPYTKLTWHCGNCPRRAGSGICPLTATEISSCREHNNHRHPSYARINIQIRNQNENP